MRITMLLLFCITVYSPAQVLVRTVDESGIPHKLKNTLAPAFKATTLDNKEISLTDYRGKVVLLNLWSLNCSLCFKEMAELNAMVKKYPKEEFVIISLVDNTKEEMMKMVDATADGYKLKKVIAQNDRIDFQIIPDAKPIKDLFTDEAASPQAFILDQNGVITFYFDGYGEKRGIPGEVTCIDFMTNEIDRLLAMSKH